MILATGIFFDLDVPHPPYCEGIGLCTVIFRNARVISASRPSSAKIRAFGAKLSSRGCRSV